MELSSIVKGLTISVQIGENFMKGLNNMRKKDFVLFISIKNVEQRRRDRKTLGSR